MPARHEVLITLLATLIVVAYAFPAALPLVLSGLAMAFTLHSLVEEKRSALLGPKHAKVRQDLRPQK